MNNKLLDNTITLNIDFFEHLLSCLSNQKFINYVNADSVDEDIEGIQRGAQEAIDDAFAKAMHKLEERKKQLHTGYPVDKNSIGLTK